MGQGGVTGVITGIGQGCGTAVEGYCPSATNRRVPCAFHDGDSQWRPASVYTFDLRAWEKCTDAIALFACAASLEERALRP
jgi:hypothetical protein